MRHSQTANRVAPEGDDEVNLPDGRPIPGLPTLTRMIRGLQGITAIIGGTGIGKSTLAAQIAGAVAAPDFPVVYADMEGYLGPSKSLASIRVQRMFGQREFEMVTVKSYDDAVENVKMNPSPALLVLDTLQKCLPPHAEGAELGTVTVAVSELMKELEKACQARLRGVDDESGRT
jgi:predicted ATP-dependent serine protease